jgi:opacity protein-like surface antigen
MVMKIVITVSAAALVAAAAVAALAVAPAQQIPPAGAWRTFEGTWSASGQHQALPTESGRSASTMQLSGAVAITAGEGLSHGFRGEVIGFDDGGGVTVLHGVWTDEHGDRIFSQLRGETVASGRRIVGTITGGTGRYAGINGEYSFHWQYVVEAEAGTVQGRAVGLRGRFRAGGAGK